MGSSGDSIPVIYSKMGIENAWNYSNGSGVTLANLDTGINALHPEFSNWQYATVYGDPVDYNGHGTHAAGVMGAPRNGQYMAGVAWGANHVSVKHSDGVTSVSAWRIVDAIDLAVDTYAASVLNMPFRSESSHEVVDDAIEDRYINDDVVFVAASGSAGLHFPGSDVIFPAEHPFVVSVPAVDYDTDDKFHCSHDGPENEFAAYQGMPTTGHQAIDGSYWGESGNTSNASTIIAGIVTLVRSRFPSLRNYEVRSHLRKYVTDLGAFGRDDKFGWGVPQADDAVNPPSLNVDISGPDEVRTNYGCTWRASSHGGVGIHSYSWYINGAFKTAGYEMSAVLPSQGGEVKVTAVDDIGNQNTEAIVVDVSPSNGPTPIRWTGE
jgi:subtilisin